MGASDATPGQALSYPEVTVKPEWVDYNGHMNDAAYALLFSQATDALMDWLGLDSTFRSEHGYTIYTLELHIRYLQEAHQGDRVSVGLRLLDRDAKRLHVLMTLRDARAMHGLATGEMMLMGIDTASGRPGPFPAPIEERIDTLWQQHGCTEWPAGTGRPMGIRRNPSGHNC